MTTSYRTLGFIFKKEDKFEADRNFSVFTKDFGRVEVLGKSIRKIASKLRGGIEIFSFSEIEFVQGKVRKTLTDSVAEKRFNNIYKPEKLKISYNISEMLDDFLKGEEKDEKIMSLIEDVFTKLEDYKKENCSIVYYYFLWNFISLLGYEPELSNCPICQQKLNPYNLYFSNKEGGVICRSCYSLKKESLKIKSDIVKILRLILKKDFDILSRLKISSDIGNSLSAVSEGYKNYLSPKNI
ncbi:MAG: DNA repair protein RecO [Candidatus Staskawiczbacteria bacterium RIFCSPHIGHO2_02_FULL_34_9]|uniref:DNA repair protein RecO n=1 Tax=Candidatus Staskawiczbacteria bacterium RIFCSPHIGHO2_02_FULL_34_9 TaxID=1802206 RepID=A0A1G2I0N9_9BACT|nr:MAG: DNA repair protein RecO [Candidatus Staskawiczbacteria bacterium RIFCSPHIGHO2_02_FULL_34_9]